MDCTSLDRSHEMSSHGVSIHTRRTVFSLDSTTPPLHLDAAAVEHRCHWTPLFLFLLDGKQTLLRYCTTDTVIMNFDKSRRKKSSLRGTSKPEVSKSVTLQSSMLYRAAWQRGFGPRPPKTKRRTGNPTQKRNCCANSAVHLERKTSSICPDREATQRMAPVFCFLCC